MIEGKDREETIRLTAEVLGLPLSEAAMMYAIEHGDAPPTGDVIEVDAGPDDPPATPARPRTPDAKPYVPLRKVKEPR